MLRRSSVNTVDWDFSGFFDLAADARVPGRPMFGLLGLHVDGACRVGRSSDGFVELDQQQQGDRR